MNGFKDDDQPRVHHLLEYIMVARQFANDAQMPSKQNKPEVQHTADQCGVTLFLRKFRHICATYAPLHIRTTCPSLVTVERVWHPNTRSHKVNPYKPTGAIHQVPPTHYSCFLFEFNAVECDLLILTSVSSQGQTRGSCNMQPKELALVMRTQLRAGKQRFKHKFGVIMLKWIQARFEVLMYLNCQLYGAAFKKMFSSVFLVVF